MSRTSSFPDLSVNQTDWLIVTANCLLSQKYPERALTLLQFLLCFEPANQPALQMAGYCYHLTGQHEKALDTFGALAPAFRSANPISGLLNAKVLTALGREEEALVAFDQFCETLDKSL